MTDAPQGLAGQLRDALRVAQPWEVFQIQDVSES